jgi:hypothetical protein
MLKQRWKPGVVVHTYNPALRKLRQEDHEKATLGYSETFSDHGSPKRVSFSYASSSSNQHLKLALDFYN